MNKVIYNGLQNAVHPSDQEQTRDPIFANVVAHFFRKGPYDDWAPDWGQYELYIPEGIPGHWRPYLESNLGPNRPRDQGDEWVHVDGSRSYRTNACHAAKPVTTWPAELAYERVLRGAGPVVPQRDAVDARVVLDASRVCGRIIDAVYETPGYPASQLAKAPRGRDHDGMPDAGETEHGLDPDDSTDGSGDLDGDGYTYVEEFLESLVPAWASGTLRCATSDPQPGEATRQQGV